MDSAEQQSSTDPAPSPPPPPPPPPPPNSGSGSSSSASSTPPAHHPQLKPALKSYRPFPLRRPSNPPAAMIVEGPTPTNADDAQHTRDNFQLLWERDPSLRTPDSASASPVTKSVSFKDKKSAQCLIYVEPEEGDDGDRHDDSHTYDNFDRLWERDPHFAGDVSMPSKVVHQLQEPGTPVSELLKIKSSDMIQKHIVAVVNCTASSICSQQQQSPSASSSSENRLCKSNVVYDPVAGKDRRLWFDISYDTRSQNEEDGTADKTIQNAGVSVRCDVQVQVVLKVEPMQDPERKFLFNFHHSVKVSSDFKLETEASVDGESEMEVADILPEELPHETGVVSTLYRVKHRLAVLHRWAAAAATPKAVLQRRMSASSSSSSQSLAHQDYFQLQEQQLMIDEERRHESDDGDGGGGMKRSRSLRRRSLQRSNSK